ncbi:MAG: hypothetical protein EBU70_11250, partial [Actinobacteria bacterium]|nr:hypothetical protein [Actinomycetota bacterium]
DGGWHRHLNMTLLAASGASAPEAGVYLARLELYSTAPGIAPSEETWLVMGANALPEDFAAAFAAAESALNPPACPADLDGDGQVSGADLGALLGNWGMPGVGDLDGSGAVTGADLGALLGAWGACP